MDTFDRKELENLKHDQRLKLERLRDRQRLDRDAQRARERINQQDRIQEKKREIQEIMGELQLKFKPEELELLFEDYCRRRNVDLQFLTHELRLNREDQRERDQSDLKRLHHEEMIQVEGHLLRKLIDIVLSQTFAADQLTSDERDEVREIARNVAKMGEDDKAHRLKISDDLDILAELERKMRDFDDDDDDQFNPIPSRR